MLVQRWGCSSTLTVSPVPGQGPSTATTGTATGTTHWHPHIPRNLATKIAASPNASSAADAPPQGHRPDRGRGAPLPLRGEFSAEAPRTPERYQPSLLFSTVEEGTVTSTSGTGDDVDGALAVVEGVAAVVGGASDSVVGGGAVVVVE